MQLEQHLPHAELVCDISHEQQVLVVVVVVMVVVVLAVELSRPTPTMPLLLHPLSCSLLRRRASVVVPFFFFMVAGRIVDPGTFRLVFLLCLVRGRRSAHIEIREDIGYLAHPVVHLGRVLGHEDDGAHDHVAVAVVVAVVAVGGGGGGPGRAGALQRLGQLRHGLPGKHHFE